MDFFSHTGTNNELDYVYHRKWTAIDVVIGDIWERSETIVVESFLTVDRFTEFL